MISVSNSPFQFFIITSFWAIFIFYILFKYTVFLYVLIEIHPKFSKIVEILKDSLPTKGVLDKKRQLDNNRQNLLIGEVEHIWREIDQYDNWELLYEKINNIRKLGYLLESEKLVNL